LSIAQCRLIFKQLRLHLLQLHLVRAGINYDQQLAFLYRLAFLEVDAHDLPINPALDIRRIEGSH